MRANVLSKTNIYRLLLHRPPFLFINGAVENVIGRRVVAYHELQHGREMLDRFKLLEAMGQAGALVLRQVS